LALSGFNQDLDNNLLFLQPTTTSDTMTTAHRPTWYPAIGGENQGGNKQYMPTASRSAKDIPGFTKMKYRYELIIIIIV